MSTTKNDEEFITATDRGTRGDGYLRRHQAEAMYLHSQLYDESRLVAEGMKAQGGGFMQRLGEALLHADSRNSGKIMVTWPDEWEYYRDVGRELRNRR